MKCVKFNLSINSSYAAFKWPESSGTSFYIKSSFVCTKLKLKA